jgi:DNA mismatch repair protein MutL
MGIINILDSRLYNKIAAGEVVERPSSVVKELLDNSIDAKADDIKIEIKGGGLISISVKDNGSGILKEDLAAAFLPHATSKISCEEDLDGIKTLGFRGEALASIAAVSMVRIISSVDNSGIAASLDIKAGVVTAQGECSGYKGTYINVENLFFNTPARLKFLKSERAEEAEIVNIVSRYILSNPKTRIKLTCDGKNVFQSSGQGLKDALNCVYGKDILNNVIELNFEKDDMVLKGYIGKPSYSKPNKTYQTATLNGRYIINNTISAAINNAYGEFLMKRQYPFYVLHLTMPLKSVDVNVHPNKMDVRFEDNKKIFSIFYNPIYKLLHSSMQSDVLCKMASNADIYDNNNSAGGYIQEIIQKYEPSDKNITDLKCKDIYYEGLLNIYKNNSAETNCIKENTLSDNVGGETTNDNYIDIKENKNINNVNILFDNNILIDNNIKDEILYEIKCTIFDTYILVEKGDAVFFIDQHAAHERILYDKFLISYEKKENAIQYLIVPYLLNVNANENIFLYNNMVLLNSLGFIIELFGNNVFKISAVPLIFSDIDLNKFFNDILTDLNKQVGNTADYIKEEIIKKACHAAVKAGSKLEKVEIDSLLKQLFSNKVLLCPHGRPIIIKYTRQDMDKLFKRIL